MKSKFIRTVSKFLFTGILFSALLFFSSCDTWMSNDDFMSEIESEVHDANAEQISVYVRYANAKMGSTEPQGRTTMKVDVASKISAITSDDYGFVKWAAFSTNDFPTDKQHSALTYVSEEDYNENYKKKELPSSVIKFSNPNSISTDVKILSARNDIFIIPIVTTRPTYVQSVPANGRSAVVKNSSIRIRFSKAIDKKTLYDSEGACNISITSSPAVFTDDDNEMEAKDITEDFDFEFSPSGKMLTLTLKDDALLDNNSQITITIYEGLCDEYGFSMSKNYSFSFTTGTKTDSLAPMIEVLVGAKDDSGTVDTFVSYYNGAPDNKHNPQLEGKATDSSRAAGIDLTKYTDELYAQRVYDSLNIFVKANDIIGADQNVAHDSNTLSEENVAFIGLQATLFTNNNGDAPDTTKNGTKIEKKNYGYVPGSKDSGVTSKKLFTDIVPLDKDGKKYSGGTIYTYDLKDLEDGLIRIDVWAIDMVGNSGEWGAPGASYYKDHDNGFKSIFVIKDTTPIDSNTVKTQKKVVSNSEAAPYYWYNSQTLKTMLLFDKPENKITDSGHPKLRSLDENLFWTFAVGSENNIAPEASSNEWVRIHNATTGESIPFPLNNAVEPTKDGSVDITVFLKDDLGNVSKPVVLDSIMYDNTKPTVTLKSGKGDFVTATGVEDLHVSGTENKVIEQILKVTIDEKNEDNAGSGIRRIEIHVKKDGQEVAVPLDPTKFAVKYAPSSITNPTPSSTGIIPVSIVPAGTDSSMAALDENKVKVFKVTDSNKITSGTLFVYGITLGDSDGTYKVEVDLYDSAMNKTPATAVTQISRDTTDPVISKVQVMDVKAREVYGESEKTWWLPYDRFEDANNLTKVTLKITANEAGSGLKYLKLAENAEFTENTKLYVGSELLTRDTNYTLNTATKTIELLDWYTPKLINANNGSHEITLENIKLNNINVAADAPQGQGNKIKFTVDDFVGKTKNNENNIYYGDTAVTGTLVYADSIAPELTYLHIEDNAEENSTNNPDNKGYDKDNFTNSQNVDLTLTLGNTETGNKGSGVNKVILSDNAVFTDSTQIYLDTNATPLVKGSNGDYEITTENEKSVANFKKVFTETNTLKFTNVKIISSEQGNQLVKADVKDFAGIQSASKASNTIIYDNKKPTLTKEDGGEGVYWLAENDTVTAGNANSNVINNQRLLIHFEESTAGVRVIKLDITKDNETTSYATPFDSGIELKYFETDEDPDTTIKEALVSGTDYIIDGRYIILTQTYKTGLFTIQGIKLKNSSDEGSYKVNVSLFDGSQNEASSPTFIEIDTVDPLITEDLKIPLIYRTVELTTSGTTPTIDGYWISKDYVNGSNKAADNIPVYIKVKEKSSGLKVIEFTGNAILTANTKLYTVSGSTQTIVDESKYTKDYTANTITINKKADSRELFRRTDNSEFELLVTNVGFNQENKDTETKASSNTIKVILSDVAKNRDASGRTQAQPTLYSDSRTPAAPASLTLTDRSSLAERTAGETIGASVGYTNDSIVDMTFSLSNCEKTGSGYHKFVLTGATFKKVGSANAANATTNEADATSLTMKSGSAVIEDLDYEFSADGRTLTLKKRGQQSSDDYYAVVRQAVNVTINNVHLDNATTQGSHTVTLTAYDMTGWASDVSSTSITLDTSIPTIEGNGPFVANYKVGTSPSYYYNPAINVYPHVSSDIETVYGTPVNSIPTFYTATSYSSSGVSQVNGQISLTSSAQYGVVLGFRVKDTYKVRGYNNTDYFMYYKADTNFSLTKKEILSSGSPLYYGSANRITQSASYTATSTNYALWFGFTPGNYSAVVLDSAGNVSNVFRFSVVKDTAKPAETWGSGSDADSLNNRVLLQMPDNSAKAYTNSAVVVAEKTDFPTFNADYMSAYAIRTKKYIIKDTGANKKYKIQLNLGGTYTASTPIRKIDNTEATTTTKYTELDATTTSSPIEMYAVSTYYGSWPIYALSRTDSGSSWKYAPVVPYGTTFPSGQTHDVHKYAEDSSNLAYVLGHNYFGYESGRPESSAWKIPNTNVTWHNYKYTGSWVTDSGNGIRSQIDSNNNLIIEIPNTQSTAPVSVFLRDGCGNMQYVVCGLYEVSGKQVAVSFVIDKKLGYAETNADGAVTQPIIMQNPYMTYVSSSPSVAWPSSTSTFGFYWNNNSGNGSQGGNSALGFIKDEVKKATYYNPALDYSNIDNQYKLGLTLRFDSADYKRGSAEDILFEESLGKVTNPDPNSNTSTGDYTCRALLYCTQNATVPNYDEIMEKAANTKNSKGGFRTEWVGVRTSNDASETEDSTEENRKYKITQTTILLDYPKPNYTTLGWEVNNENKEPKPYYMWYLFEDRVGNYEIAKVVNSSVTNQNVLNGSQASTTVYDKWLYDSSAPVLNIRGTTVKANGLQTTNAATQLKDPGTTSASLATQVNKLIATNNGFVPYLDGTTVWVSTDYDRAGRSSSLLNSNTGWGTTHKVEDGNSLITKREYLPFVDLEVDEITGIRAFCWTNSATLPSGVASTGNTQGDSSENKWYAGNYATSLTYNIGISYGYGTAENAYLGTGSYGTSKYTGTKVNTLIPGSKLSADTAQPLYLHVMDWTGNIASYRIGSNNLTFKNDKKEPVSEYTDNTTIQAITSSSPNEYYVKWDGTYVNVRIAGKGAGSAENKQTIIVRYPVEYFKDYAVYTDETKILGSGYKGLSFTNYDITSVKRDATGPYLELDYDTYKDWSNSPTRTVYYYDNVGNIVSKYVKFTYDTEAPKVKSVSLVTQSSSGTEFADEEIGASKDTELVVSYGKCRSYEKPAEFYDNIAKIPASDLQVVYINKNGTSKFHVNWAEDNDSTDVADVQVNKWDKDAVNGDGSKGKWVNVTSRKDNPDQWNGDSYMGSSYSYGYELLSSSSNQFSTTGTYFQVLAVDFSGNAACQYFKIILDNQPPALTKDDNGQTIKPQITLGKGSINNVGSTYYYTADTDNPLTLKFGIVDAGSGSVSALKKFKYSFNRTTWLPENGYISDPSNIELSFTSGDIETIYFQDILGNETVESAAKPFFTYAYTNAAGTSDNVSISKLTYYAKNNATSTYYNADGTPKAPTLTEGTLAKSGKSYPVIEEISTYGVGYNDSVNYSDTAVYTKYYTQLLSEGVILIKSKERDKLKITLPMPEGIIGYLVTDENGNPVKVTKYTTTTNEDGIEVTTQEIVTGSVLNDERHTGTGSYSFTSLEHEFEETLPMILPSGLNGNYDIAKRKYWAVDVVGNISSTPLTLQYSYSDPNMAKNITLIQSIDQVTEADVKEQMQADINAHTLSFANFALKAGTKIAGNRDNKKGKVYFNNDFIVLRCDLNGKANTFAEAPALVELYDVWDGGKGMRGTSIDIRDQTGDYSDKFKVYPSNSTTTGENGETRYYCYIAFKLDKATLGKNKIFDNNDTYGGGVIHAKIYGKGQAESDIEYLTVKVGDKTVTKAMNYGWWLDTAGPVINNSDYYLTGDDVKKLKGYLIAENNTLLNGFSKAKDSVAGAGYVTNIYNSGTRISYNVNKDANTPNFKDQLTGVAKYIFVTSTGFTAAKPAAYATGWTSMTAVTQNNTSYYDFNLPVINEPHKHVALFLMDSVGNISEPYYLVDKTDTNIAWWLTDHGPQNVSIKKYGTENTPVFVDDTTPYVLNVAMDPGAVIKSITADNATIAGVEFEDYSHGQPTFDASTGKFADEDSWIAISGLKVTINVEQKWSEQPVKLSINGTSHDVFTIPAKQLTSGDIDLAPVTAENWTSSDTKTIPITLNNQAPLTLLTSLPATSFTSDVSGVTVTLVSNGEGSPYFKLEGLPTSKKWSTQEINISMSGTTIYGTITKLAVTIPAISSEDITLKLGETVLTGENGFDAETQDYTIIIEAPDTPTSVKYGETALTLSETTPKTVTITGIKKQWASHDVNLIINGQDGSESGVTKKVFTVGAIAAADIKLVQGSGESQTSGDSIEWTSGTAGTGDNAGKTVFTFKLSSPDAVPAGTAEAPSVTTTDNFGTVSFDSTTQTVTLVITQDWGTHSVGLVINGVQKDNILDVPVKALGTDDIESIGDAEPTDSGATVTINLKEGVPDSALAAAGVSVTPDTVTATLNGKVVTLTNLPDATWEAQAIKLTVGSNLMFNDVMTIQPKTLAASDITKIDEAVTTEEVTTVTITLAEGVPDSALAAAGVSVTPDTVTATLNGKVVTLTNLPAATWDAQPITLTVGNNLKSQVVKTIAANTVSASNIHLTMTQPADGKWIDNLTYVGITITVDEGLSITSVESGDSTVTIQDQTGGNYGLNGTNIPQDITVNVKTNKNTETAISVRLFPTVDPNIGSRAAFGGFKQTSASDLEVAGDAPKTRSISLRNWVADLFGGDSEAADLAAGDAAPLTKKEAKKAQKAAKKTAKAAGALKAEESSAQPAAELEDLVVAAAEAAGQTLDAAVSEAEASAKPAQIEAEASAPVMSGLEPAAGEASAEEAAPSKAALFLAMAVFCVAIAGIIIFCLKKKPAKK